MDGNEICRVKLILEDLHLLELLLIVMTTCLTPLKPTSAEAKGLREAIPLLVNSWLR